MKIFVGNIYSKIYEKITLRFLPSLVFRPYLMNINYENVLSAFSRLRYVYHQKGVDIIL